MSTAERVALANLGAEEPVLAPRIVGAPVDRLATLFERMVARPPAAWPWLRDARGCVAWLNTPAAYDAARAAGMALWGAAPAVVRQVHDKAFVVPHQHDANGEAFLCSLVTQPTLADIERTVSTWPQWARADFTLKPRYGTSGRGRTRGQNGTLSTSGQGALGRFVAGGGAVVEPWVKRIEDLSTLWRIDDNAEVHLLGTTRMHVKATGVYQGTDVVVTAAGLRSGSRFDDVVVAHARPAVQRAATLGYVGPLGVDAFVWHHPDGSTRVRAVVEVNARFTAAHVALALVHDAVAGTAAHADAFAFRLQHDVALSALPIA